MTNEKSEMITKKFEVKEEDACFVYDDRNDEMNDLIEQSLLNLFFLSFVNFVIFVAR